MAGGIVMAVNIGMTIAGKVRTEKPMPVPAQLQPAQ